VYGAACGNRCGIECRAEHGPDYVVKAGMLSDNVRHELWDRIRIQALEHAEIRVRWRVAGRMWSRVWRRVGGRRWHAE